MRNKFLSVILTIIMIFSMGVSTFAGEDSIYLNSTGEIFTRQNFNDAKSKGIIPSEYSFEEWIEIIEENERAFIELTKNSKPTIKPRGPFPLKPGDILVSKGSGNSSSSNGITGHAGIAINRYKILHIAGFGHIPEIITFYEWKTRYIYNKDRNWSKIYRVNNSNTAYEASNWAKTNYLGKNYKYGLTGSLYSLSPTYCSKIVWQAYYNTNKNMINKPLTLVLPYNLPKYFKDAYTPEQAYEYVN